MGISRATVAATLLVLILPATGTAQDATQRVRGTIGIGQTVIDETGNLSSFRERADRYEGFALRALSLHALAPHGLRIDLHAPRLDPIARDARLDVSSRLVSGSVRSARNHFFFDPSGGLRSQRDLLTGDLRLRPLRHLEVYGQYGRIDLSGRRQAIVPGDIDELGTSYDQDTETWRGGVRLAGWRSNLDVSYLARSLRSEAVPVANHGLHGIEADLRTNIWRALLAEGSYGWTRTELLRDGRQLESSAGRGRVEFVFGHGFTAGPIGRYEESTDLGLHERSRIWALGFGARGSLPRGWYDLEGESGRRESNAGRADATGLRARTGLNLPRGFTLQGQYRREARRRPDIRPLPGDLPLPTFIGTLMSQRAETRLRWRFAGRWGAEGQLARFDKDYDDLRVEQQVWRYGLQASFQAARAVRCDAGWRLDDALDERTTGRYDLRTHVLFGGLDVTAVPRLALRGRADFYRMQRDLDEWKLLVTAGAEYEVVRDLILGLSYERARFDDDADVQDYRANVLEFTLRHAFGL